MTVENNPLRQFFRRPAIYIKLPSNGTRYSSDVVSIPESGELPVFPITAIDEITLKTPDALYNGEAVANVIKSCIPAILDPWKINSVDLDAILIAIRTASDGNDQEISTTCPKCNEESKYGVNLISLLPGVKISAYDQELALGDLIVRMKPLAYSDVNKVNLKQFEAQKMYSQANVMQDLEEKTNKMRQILLAITEATQEALAMTIEYIKTPDAVVNQYEYILEFLKNCDKKTYDQIKDHSMKLKKESEIKPLQIKCVHCQHEYEQAINLNMSDFFGTGF